MTFKRDLFKEEDYERAAKILYEEGIIFAHDNRFDCFHNSTRYITQLKRILREKLAKNYLQYDYDEDVDYSKVEEEPKNLRTYYRSKNQMLMENGYKLYIQLKSINLKKH